MSRRKMIDKEFPALIAAQVQASEAKHYSEWREWMRKSFSFTLANRMAYAMGYEAGPCEAWYLDMKLVGQRIMKVMEEQERVNYLFRGDETEIDGDGIEETGFDYTIGGVRPAADRGCDDNRS